MSKFFKQTLVILVSLMTSLTSLTIAQQLPDPSFENWNGDKFDGNIQLKNWYASNVEQVGFKFNFITREAGHTGNYAFCVQDKEVGALGLVEVGPGYVGLGKPWQYLPSITEINKATAGLSGGISFKYRPDSITVWVKRTGDNWNKEDFHVLFYSWQGTAKGDKYKAKNKSCTSYSQTDEESDIRQALDGNECGTTQKATQIAEGWLRDRKQYNNWVRLSIPIYYMSDQVPDKCNVIFSAGNYPAFRANDGLYAGNSLYVDDVNLVYSSRIDQLFIGGKEWKGFDPESADEQIYSVGRTNEVPEIYGRRGAGQLTNIKGTTVTFPGRKLSGSEIDIQYGTVDGAPTVITVKAEDGSSKRVYKIKMVQEPSDNARLNSIMVNGEKVKGFNAYVGTYNVTLPYGTTQVPVVSYTKAEDEQNVVVTQASSVTGSATIKVTAADGKTTMSYTLNFSVAQLADNTLKDIKINGESLQNFNPTLSSYKVELPLGTTQMPTIEAVSAYPAGAQTITHTKPDKIDGGQYLISVTTPGNQTARVYRLNFKITASSNSKLKDLKMGDYIVLFNPDNTTYYVDLPMGTKELPAITYVAGDKEQTIKIEEGGLNGTTKITVTAGNGTSQTIYKIICSTQKSDISYLKGIYLDGKLLDGFNSNTYRYTVDLGLGVDKLPTITTTPGDEYQAEPRIVLGGLNGTTRIFVTADDGSTSLYEIVFNVSVSKVSTLSMITLDGKNLEGFSPDKTYYEIELPMGTDQLPVIAAVKGDAYQSEPIIRLGELPGDTKITGRAQDGSTTVYTLHFEVVLSAKTTLDSVYIDGKKYIDFDPAKKEYKITLPEGQTKVPDLKCFWDAKQQKVPDFEPEGNTYTVLVIAKNGATATYTFTFEIQKSENALLEMIKLDGTPLEGFQKDNFEYTVTLKQAKSPTITVDKDPTQRVTITAPAGIGTATILVQPESGAAQTYYIHFTSELQPLLSAVYINGEKLANFNESKFKYEDIPYVGVMPAVTFDVKYPGTEAAMISLTDTVRIYTSISGEKKLYELFFVPQQDNEVLLNAINIDGQLISGFKSDKFSYEYPLPENTPLPTVTYELRNSLQRAVAGQVSQYDYSILVSAENGNQVTYTIHFSTGASNNTQLAGVQLDGKAITFTNDTSKQTVGKGDDLPVLTYDTVNGQTVVSAQTSQFEQQLLVVAENGDSQHYVISYQESSETDALLKDLRYLYVDGEDKMWRSVTGFKKDVFDYTVTLPLGTKAAPSVWAAAGKPGQVITITYGAANGDTKIHVEAEDTKGKHTQDYTIHFGVTKSSNNLLKKLEIDGVEYDVEENDIVIDLPFGATEPMSILFEKGEESQLIEYTFAPISEPSKIIVTAENGQKNTYTITYKVAVPVGENVIKNVTYSYTNKEGNVIVNQPVSNLKPGDNIIDLPFGSTTFSIDGYDKNYTEQSVIFYNGGIRHGSKLIVVPNREGEKDVVYTFIPRVEELNIAGKLKELRFKGELVPNWRPDVFNYMINVTAEPVAADFSAVDYNGNTVTPSFAADFKTKKQVTFTVEGGEVYSVCWYYQNDGKYAKNGAYYDYLDFSQEWLATSNVPMWKATWTSSSSATSTTLTTGFKPQGWIVPADIVAGMEYEINIGFTKVVDLFWYTGKEVIAAGTNGAMLSTINGASINGSMPGMMTLGGTMTIKPGKSGGSTSSITYDASKFITMRNTPDSLSMRYKSLSASNISGWYYELKTIVGGTTRTDKFSGDYSTSEWRYASKPISAYTGAMSKYAISINSATSDNANTMTGSNTIYTSDLQIENLHFVYNSDLTAAKVNGKATTFNPATRTFTYEVPAGEAIIGKPELSFTKKVHDQMQTIEWADWDKGVLRATVTNYGENSLDNTVYTVEVIRTPVTIKTYETTLDYSIAEVVNDTVYFNQPFGTKELPGFQILPASPHQHFDITKDGKEIKVTVTAEDGSKQDSVYIFREVKANDAALASMSATGLTPSYKADVYTYTITADVMPEVKFGTKKISIKGEDREIGQKVNLKYTADGATLVVTAPDGETKKTYTIKFTKKAISTNGTLSNLTRGDERIFKEGTFEYEIKHGETLENIGFEHRFGEENDPVVQTIKDEEVKITVKGTKATNTYTIKYPVEKSNNTQLADILVNGKHFEGFSEGQHNFECESDTAIDVRFILKEKGQTLQISISKKASVPVRDVYKAASRSEITVINALITAENGDQQLYTFTIKPESSNISTLAGITIDGQPLEDFYPEKLNYTYTIPAAKPKLSEPTLPEVRYTLGQESQRVAVYPAQKLGGTTQIEVTAENGKDVKIYAIKMLAEPSHSAELGDILINGKQVADFKPSRTYYSTQIVGTDSEVDFAKGDPFQKVIKWTENKENFKRTIIRVTAQDETTVLEYEVDVYSVTMSNNANLADILLNSMSLETYAAKHQIEDLSFSEKIYFYTIPLSTADTLPDISARLQEDGQTIAISGAETAKGTERYIRVTAEDGETTNTYTLLFSRFKSDNTNLSAILINGDSLKIPRGKNDTIRFSPDVHEYVYPLAIGVTTIPVVTPRKGEANQETPQTTWSEDGMEANIKVTAENGETATYIVRFQRTLSTIATLSAITVKGELENIPGFRPDSFEYSYKLPMGVREAYQLEVEKGYKTQTIEASEKKEGLRTTYSYAVLAEDNIHKEKYTVTYEMQPSNVDTLLSLSLDGKPMVEFEPTKYDYTVLLPHGTAKKPFVGYVPAEKWQKVEVDSLTSSTFTQVIVTAEDQHRRVYTILFDVARSSNASLAGIAIDGVVRSDFDEDKLDYIEPIPYGMAAIPSVTYSPMEEEQIVKVTKDGNVVRIEVLAEDRQTRKIYTVTFVEGKSSEAHIKMIYLNEKPLEGFMPDNFEYPITLAYDAQGLPDVTFDLADESAKVDTIWTGDRLTLEVTAMDETTLEYVVDFKRALSPVCWLNGINIKGEALEGFHKDTIVYTITYPAGSTTDDFISAEDLTFVKADESETVTVNTRGDAIEIIVTAADGENTRAYVINQIILKRSNSLLESLSLVVGKDTVLIDNFADSVYVYEYVLREGEVAPEIIAIPQDESASISITTAEIGEYTIIYCTAEDGSETQYKILFRVSAINEGLMPTANDVLIKRVPGTMQIFVATIRKDVQFALYDQYGNPIFPQPINLEPAGPNDVDVVIDTYGKERLNDIHDMRSGLLITLEPGQIYLYGFYQGGKKVIYSGKIIAIQ